MEYIFLAVGILVCGILAIRASRLLISAIWLAITSALVAVLIFLLGAPQLAVIELSVGAGLVTVLFVFAINISGEEAIDHHSVLPKPYAWGSLGLALALLILLILKEVGFVTFPTNESLPTSILWESRYLDMILQVVLIFAGVLGVIGLLAAGKPSTPKEDQE
jgi:uncharacterized MnhB-related membrane protein